MDITSVEPLLKIIVPISILALLLLQLILTVLFKKKSGFEFSLKKNLEQTKDFLIKFENSLEKMEKSMKDDFQRNREETSGAAKNQREELSKSLESFKHGFEVNIKNLNELLENRFTQFSKQQVEINETSEQRIKEVRQMVESQLKDMREDNSKQLNEVRKTVDEKLQRTLNERLSQSFETVGKQLKSVQEGLGEMRTLASDVGGLKKVLSNVKMRGGLGEMQLEMLLEQILAPEQYATNVETKKDSGARVEFAIKLPGKDKSGDVVYLPIDAKFPKDIFEKLQDAYAEGEVNKIETARKELENAIKKMAKDISDKYIDPPNTTDFGIMFLPFEGIYAEIVRKADLLETISRDYKIIVAGPPTLAIILNSLQMGFRTLAIEKRSSEVWNILGGVKKEFDKFGGMMQSAQKSIQKGLDDLDDVMGPRTRAIQRKLKEVEFVDGRSTKEMIPDLSDGVFNFDKKAKKKK